MYLFCCSVPRQIVILLAEDNFFLPCSVAFSLWSDSQLLGLVGLITVPAHIHTHTHEKHLLPRWSSRPFMQLLGVLPTLTWPTGASGSWRAPLSHINTLSTHLDMLCQWKVPPYQISSGLYWCEGTEEGRNGYIFGNNNPCQVWGTRKKHIFVVSHPILFQVLLGSIWHSYSPASSQRKEGPLRFGFAISVSRHDGLFHASRPLVASHAPQLPFGK